MSQTTNERSSRKAARRHDDRESGRIQGDYHQLNERLRDPDAEATPDDITNVVTEADKILEQADRTTEIREHANTIYESSRVSGKIIKETNIGKEFELDIKSVILPNFKENFFPSGKEIYQGAVELGENFYKVGHRPLAAEFMLGPIYLTKKPINRKARNDPLQNAKQAQTSAAKQLNADDIEQGTDHSTETIKDIYLRLENQVKHDGPVALYQFILNPNSYAQSVENLFFMSFLVRDGKVSLSYDEDGIPIISTEDLTRTNQESAAAAAAKNPASTTNEDRKQVIINLDQQSYEELIEIFQIEEPFIPTRENNTDGTFR